MRKLIVSTLMSLDGYVSGEGGNFMVMPLDESFSDYNVEVMRPADTYLLGATTFRQGLQFWPDVVDDESHRAADREISSLYNQRAKVVVSDSLTADETGAWRDSTEIVRRADALDRIAEMKQEAGGDIVVFGSATMWNDLLAAGLVDELHVQLGAGAIGSGEPAFRAPFGGQASNGELRVLEVRQLEGSQNVLIKYAVSAGGSSRR